MNTKNSKDNMIELLPDFIANQIAAGEVVQRPDSVVKELVENSIDAGADTIAVIVREAGKKLIHVVDNGIGIKQCDLELSIQRHATSKIRTSEDLEKILTFGFRGEALASVSSISHLEIRTRNKDEELGSSFVVDPNTKGIITPLAHEQGTQIFVKDLFFNVPARRKFLKSNLTEFRHISTTMLKFALSYPEIRFTFYDGNTLIFDFKPETKTERLLSALGREYEDNLIEVNYDNGKIHISGFIADYSLNLKNRSRQFLFLNKRSIINRAINHAIYTAMDHLIEKDFHPVFVLNIEINPEEVDINVHPQKHEVKFENERMIYNSMVDAVNEALRKYNLIPEFMEDDTHFSAPIELNTGIDIGEREILVNRDTGEVLNSNRSNIDFRSNFETKENRSFSPANFNREREFIPDSAAELLYSPKQDESEEILTQLNFDDINDNNYWQLFDRYLLLQVYENLFVIDINSAIQRINFDKIKDLWSDNIKADSKELLFSERLNLSYNYIFVLKEKVSLLEKLGYKFNIYDDYIEITAKSIYFSDENTERIITNLLDELIENESLGDDVIINSISKLSGDNKKIERNLKKNELISLLKDLLKSSNPLKSPSSGQIIRKIEKTNIYKYLFSS